jgi:NAD(P)-dependent dehydrogenase (short-subunit alcohol dehydrogenase family)
MAELRFDGRVAIVTGGATGLGAGHVRLLAGRGAAVVVNDLDGAAAAALVDELVAAGGRAVAAVADIADADQAAAIVGTAVDTFGRVDIVVNNAGLMRPMPFADLTVDLWDRIVSVNLRGTFLVTHAAWPHLVEQGYGRIVSTTSNSGLLGVAGSTPYSAAKAAVWGMTRSLALEGGPLGIHVNAIAPMAYTAMSAASKIAPEAWRTGEGDAWSRRLDVARVAPAVGWLAHETCALNGQVLSAVGGRVARFVMRVTDGFVDDDVSIESVRDHEASLLADDDVGVEYRAASQEGRDLLRRLLS